MADKHALVFGASGITGWAVVNELLAESTDAQRFRTVTALTNCPLPSSVSRWPENLKLKVISGIDLLKGSQMDLENDIRNKVMDISGVTHVFFNCKRGPLICTRIHTKC